MSLSDYKLVHSGGVAQVVTGGVSIGEVYETRGKWCGAKANKTTKLFETKIGAIGWISGCHMKMMSGLTA